MPSDFCGLRSDAVNIDRQVLAFNPAKVAQPVPDRFQWALIIRIILHRLGDKNADTPHPV